MEDLPHDAPSENSENSEKSLNGGMEIREGISESTDTLRNRLYNRSLLHPVFDRQMRVPNWDQDAICNQIVLCLGCGGLGCSVALECARLGVRKIILVDYDVVESHNLNRQILFGRQHVGLSKVECAKESLLALHAVREDMEVEAYHLDAKAHWDTIVTLSKESSVIFNLIDQGFEWDVAVQSLALLRRIPFISGGTFQTTATTDFCSADGSPCLLCMGSQNTENISHLTPECISELKDVNFIRQEEYPVGASTVFVASTCANLMVASWIQHLLNPLSTDSPNRAIMYLSDLSVCKWRLEAEDNCLLCSNIIERRKAKEDKKD